MVSIWMLCALAHTRERAAQSPAGRPATPRPLGPANQAAAANAQRCAPPAGTCRRAYGRGA